MNLKARNQLGHIGTSLKLVFITNYIPDKTIPIKYALLTNHDP